MYDNDIPAVWIRISIIALCPGEMCIWCYLIQTCRECHWDEVFNWGPVSAAKRREERPPSCISIPRHVKATGFFNFIISWLLCRSTQSKARISPELKGRSLFSWTTEKTNHLCLWEMAVWGEFSGSFRVQLFKFMTEGPFFNTAQSWIQHLVNDHSWSLSWKTSRGLW